MAAIFCSVVFAPVLVTLNSSIEQTNTTRKMIARNTDFLALPHNPLAYRVDLDWAPVRTYVYRDRKQPVSSMHPETYGL